MDCDGGSRNKTYADTRTCTNKLETASLSRSFDLNLGISVRSPNSSFEMCRKYPGALAYHWYTRLPLPPPATPSQLREPPCFLTGVTVAFGKPTLAHIGVPLACTAARLAWTCALIRPKLTPGWYYA